MRKILFLIIFPLTHLCFGQTVQQAEFFWDNDPGPGNGYSLTAFDGNFNQAFELAFTNNAILPSMGNHVLNVRVKGNDGSWSPTFKKIFRSVNNSNSNLGVKISQAEFFWDDDPGLGNGVTLLAFDGNFNQAFESAIANNVILPLVGNHVLSVRVKGGDGAWSPTFKKVFRLVNNSNTNLGVKITQAEYFWDVDPGLGNGVTLLAFDGNFDQALETVFTNNATLPTIGDHIFNVRIKSQDSTWGPAFKKVFRFSENNNTNLEAKITQAEYFWDNDPGVGNGFTMVAFDGNFNQAIEVVLASSANLPDVGDHVINIRVKALDGNWSPSFRKVFRLVPNNNTNFEVKITQGEYFWDADPGAGNGYVLLAFDGNYNNALESAIATSGINPGPGIHLLNTRFKAADGNWGTTYKRVIGLDILYDNRVTLISPTNTATQVPLSTNLVWNAFTGAGNYEYVLSTDPTFSTVAFTGIVNGTSIPVNGLSPNTVYYWRVRVNDANNVSLWSVVWSFTTTNSLSVNDDETVNQTILYPVPADTRLFIKQNIKEVLLKYELFSIDGKFLNDGELDNDLSVDVSYLSTGIYMIKLVNSEGQSKMLKFSRV